MRIFRDILFIIGSIVILNLCNCKKDEVQPELAPPTTFSPTNVTDNQFTANWTRVADADSYQLDVSLSIDFSSFVDGYDSKTVTDTFEIVTDLVHSTDYYYRVRAIVGDIVTGNSNVRKVTTTLPITSLKEAATSFYVGTIAQSGRMTGQHDELFRSEFSSMTAEYEMKMRTTYPSNGTYNWGPADAIVNYAYSNEINMHGHALIWHSSIPDWVTGFSGTDQEFETMIEDYIKTVVTRYKGKVTSWDVVNEAFSDGTGTLRNSVFYQRMGADYIAKCFTWANEADPDVLLFYNDYNMCSDASKRGAVFAMVDDFIERGIPIHGVGFQMHIAYNWPSKQDIINATNEIIDRDLLVHYSEVDIKANPDNDINTLTAERSTLQAVKYQEIAEIYNAIPNDNKYAITVWGLKDDESWLIDFSGHSEWALLFDSNYNKKEAYYGFLEGIL